ncbi:QueT transporter family protein [Clostridium sp. CM028]|nr:QueT transporter family protein [Clostridium sp. CM028]MBU3092977.1 QueT transporter family protein [Clostridium sp. CF011]MBW9147681.1 QueT transporter family protein [Clostridium sp. CM028]WAG71544.1 QueT transporter family protein [Clostridium sp. CF011]WLC63286.1 QueT transporter family protein [Clostridium sp. CM028]
MIKIKELTIAALVMAMYIVIMYLTQGFSFGPYQIRMATSLYALGYIYPFLIVPMGVANLLSNTLMGGLGVFDMIGGTMVGIITTTLIYLIKRFNLNKWMIVIPIVFIPGLLVPIWLSYLLHIPYFALAISLCIGQIIPGIVGVFLIKRLERNANIVRHNQM